MPTIDTDALLESIKQAATGQLKLTQQHAAEFLAYLQAEKAGMAAAIATGLPDQPAIVGFRLAGWARKHAVDEIRAAEQRLFDIITTAITVAMAFA